MTKTEANEPAFSSIDQIEKDYYNTNLGLTKHEYFTAKAMQGLLSCSDNTSYMTYEDIAKHAVLMSDALIKILNERQK